MVWFWEKLCNLIDCPFVFPPFEPNLQTFLVNTFWLDGDLLSSLIGNKMRLQSQNKNKSVKQYENFRLNWDKTKWHKDLPKVKPLGKETSNQIRLREKLTRVWQKFVEIGTSQRHHQEPEKSRRERNYIFRYKYLIWIWLNCIYLRKVFVLIFRKDCS